jgi:DNA modification methylase
LSNELFTKKCYNCEDKNVESGEFMSNDHVNHINYALVEDTRPPMYKAMKYWGKKPHNIWADFIETYCPKDGIVLDPFSGSGVAALEAIQLGRRAFSFDLNPLSSFYIEVLTSEFDENSFLKSYKKIIDKINKDPIYKEHYIKDIHGQSHTIYNFKWRDNQIHQVAYKNKGDEGFNENPDIDDITNANNMHSIKINDWFPTQKFPQNPSISHKFIKDIGGNSFQYLWTRRNLYILALIFKEILSEKDKDIKNQLLYGFIQSLHLTSKMVVPRNEGSNRAFSGSWGRADYLIRRNSMEQNPLIIFQRACTGRQSVIKSLNNVSERLPSNRKINDLAQNKKIKKTANINYGTIDVADLTDFIDEKSIDFIITDPPYGGLVQYLDLSLVWLVWLQKVDKKYIPDFKSEITFKKNIVSREEYRRKLNNAFKQMHTVLNDDGYLVVTFHHNKIEEWNEFIQAIKLSGFKIDKVTHQYNKRSGESNVSNPYGTSGADFYIRCVKHREVDFTDDSSGFEHYVVQKTIEIIAKRTEPTPFTFIINGLVPEMLQAGYLSSDDNKEIEKILSNYEGEGKIFKKKANTENKAGDIWWFNNEKEFIEFSDMPLKERVSETILSLLRRKVAVKYDDVIAEIFKKYPNGLTPDLKSINQTLSKFAYKSSNKWKISETTLLSTTIHTEIIRNLLTIAHKSKYESYVGKREQPEVCKDGKRLREHATLNELDLLKKCYSKEKIERLEMIDTLWISKKDVKIEAALEVENSTDFISAIQRASNLESTIPKFMIIPNEREKELLNSRDPLFVDSFKDNNWRYLTYEDIYRIASYSNPTVKELTDAAKNLRE